MKRGRKERRSLDLAKLQAEVEAKRGATARAIEQARYTVLVGGDVLTEKRVLSTVLVQPSALALYDDVETDDFVSIPRKHVHAAIRNLQARGEPIGALEVVDEIARVDRAQNNHVGDTVDAAYVGMMLLDFPPYLDEALFAHSLGWLRELAVARRLA